MAGASISNGRPYPPSSSSNPPMPLASSGQQEINDGDTSRGYGRDASGLRGRVPGPGSLGMSNIHTQPAGPVLSPRSQSSAAATRPSVGLERRPSATTAHYRQTSKAHVSNTQARNAIFVTSPATSPLSPETSEAGPDAAFLPDFNTMARRGTSHRRPSESPSSTIHGSMHSASTSTLVTDRDIGDTNGSTSAQKRLDRAQSSKTRREHSHGRSRSRNQHEQKTVGEYALHHLFTKFVFHADKKIEQCILDAGSKIEDVCGAGVDPEFDQLISALAHINRRKPRTLVDSIMLWRKQRSDGPRDAKNDTLSPNSAQNGLTRRNAELAHMQHVDSGHIDSSCDEPGYVTKQRSGIAIYFICRVLIEVFSQTDISALTPALFDKLEGIVFSEIEHTEPEGFSTFSFKRANWNISGQLLGVMSTMNLQSIARCFINSLRSSQKELGVKGAVTRNLEGRSELIIMAMQHIHVRTQPESLWRDSCDFLYNLGELFINAHGQPLKHAYCQILEDLVIAIAANWGTQVNTVKWKEFLSHVNSRLSQMLMKPRHWQEAFRLSTVVLCASPTEQFASLWLPTATSLQAKLKDRVTRATALQVNCRLVWTYLYRVAEPSTSALRKLDDVMKVVLPSGKKNYLSTDAAFSKPIIELIRIIGYGYPDYCFKTIISPLINADYFLSTKEPKVEQLEPERMVVGIRAFMLIMTDLEQGEQGRPPFPRFNSGGLAIDPRTVPELLSTSEGKGKASSMGEQNDELRPVSCSKLGEPAKEFFARFCEILGKITLGCNIAFGGQAVLDEKFGGLTPKTPITDTFSFGRREDHMGIADAKQGFYELLHVAIQAVPRCLSPHLPLKPLINLLCTGTAHVQSTIAASSTESLKSIARHGHAQAVSTAFANFIFNFDARYSTMSDEGMLGPAHIENTLRLYVELLQVWIEEIKRKTRDAATEPAGDGSTGSRSLQLGLTSLSPHVEEVEAHGVFFLCSQSRRVRAYAVKVLKMVTELDTALGSKNDRIINILEGDSERVMDINDESLNVAERSRLQKGKRSSMVQHTLVEICSSDVSYDTTLWMKLFPNIIRNSLEVCPGAVMMGREIVCSRLLQMQNSIKRLDSDVPGTPLPATDWGTSRTHNRFGATPPEVIIEQWKLYLVMACTTMKDAGAQTQSQLDQTQHTRKVSRGVQQGQKEISSARALLAYVIPLLSAGQSSIRDAIVIALGSIHIKLYRTLLDSLGYAVTKCKVEARQRIGSHQRNGSNPQKDRGTDRLRTEVTQVYRLTARFLHERSILQDEWILNNLSVYTKELMIFLSDAEVQNDWECQKLRRQYCGLLEELFNGINRTADPSRYMAFESRKSAFALMEEWCGYSPNQNRIHQREHMMRQSALEWHRDTMEKTKVTAAMEIEKKELSTAALSAMAALCAGPIKVQTDRGEFLSFDSGRMLQWINQIFDDEGDKLHTIGRRALYNLISQNRGHSYLMEHSIERCYEADRPRALESYFEVVMKILNEDETYPVAFWRILGAMLITLGNEKGEIRMKSAKMLQRLEQRLQQSSKIQDFDISISDRTTAVYKLAQFEISKRLSIQHTELAFFVFSQFSSHFRISHPDTQRNMVAAILPWIQVIELQVDPRGGPTAQSYMLLANLLEITTKTSGGLHNEIQALWQALATGPHAGNVQLVLDFIISLCLDRRDQSFVDYAKQIVVYLSSTPAGQKVVEFLLMQITPKNMVQKPREPTVLPPDSLGLPYVADLSVALPISREQNGFSLGQLSMIFLVDLMVAPVNLSPESVPLLLQVILVLWDHHVPLVQEQAREMLVHLIHELVITKIDDVATTPRKYDIEAFVESIRQKESNTVWQYKERAGKFEQWSFHNDEDDMRVPVAMPPVTSQVIDLFALAYPQIQNQLAKVALSWGTSCPVRHIACRSLQIFRCILVPLDRPMLIDILARISNTVVHEGDDVQLFSIEMLTTVKSIIGALEPAEVLQYPHLFWTACACLDTIYEREFVATLTLLNILLLKVNLSDPAVVKLLEKTKPTRWQGSFEGIAALVYKGLKSEMALERSIHILDSLVALPDSDLVGDQSRLLFGTLANLPRFLHCFDDQSMMEECVQSAEILASKAVDEGKEEISTILIGFATGNSASSGDFLRTLLSAVGQAFFPTWELTTLIFVIGLLTNRLHWYKVKTLEVLQVLIRDIDTSCPEIANYGPDLISPLLRLLQTQYCPQAIEVLDHIMFMSETPMTQTHIRMSLHTGLGSRSRHVRKEYEKTQSLYGIPEESGWSIPMPAVHSNATRANMQVIHHDCANPTAPEADAVPTPEIEFHPDEDQQSSYFFLERSDPQQGDDSGTDANPECGMGDLVSKLNSLDDFFDDNLDADNDVSDRYSTLTVTPFTHDLSNSADFYDQESAPILQRTLARTASVTSLHNGLADLHHLRDPAVMSPTAFNPPTNNNTLFPPTRPSLHSRSATSPANNLPLPTGHNPNDLLSEDEEADFTFSEDERATGNNGSSSGSKLSSSLRNAQSALRKMAPGLEGKDFRQRGLRRAQSQSRNHSQAPGSPRVPKVPEAYLQPGGLRREDTF